MLFLADCSGNVRMMVRIAIASAVVPARVLNPGLRVRSPDTLPTPAHGSKQFGQPYGHLPIIYPTCQASTADLKLHPESTCGMAPRLSVSECMTTPRWGGVHVIRPPETVAVGNPAIIKGLKLLLGVVLCCLERVCSLGASFLLRFAGRQAWSLESDWLDVHRCPCLWVGIQTQQWASGRTGQSSSGSLTWLRSVSNGVKFFGESPHLCK